MNPKLKQYCWPVASGIAKYCLKFIRQQNFENRARKLFITYHHLWINLEPGRAKPVS